MNDHVAAVQRLRKTLAGNSRDGIAWHNLAAAEGDLGHAPEAESAARRAIALGIQAPETHLVLARALQVQRRFDEADRAFEKAIRLRPGYVDAHRDLAQLAWMRTADATTALRRVDGELRRDPRQPGLHLVRSIVLEFANDNASALEAAQAGLVIAATDVDLLRQAAHLSANVGEPERALALAHRALAVAPAAPDVRLSVCEALLACGRHAEATPLLEALRAQDPENQHILAILALAWRLAGDPRYRELFDYGSLVEARYLDAAARTPDFLARVVSGLQGMHQYEAHPLQQSVRGGSQVTLEEADRDNAPLAGLFESIERAASTYLARIGRGNDPMRSRNTGQFAISGAWSVRLRSGGYHADHVHQKGWLSAVCYLSVPPRIGAGAQENDRAGWLRLGKPGIATRPPLPAERHVKPEPGLVVLFPAYMWHGVEPFEDDAPRLSVAMDIVPV
ncbi:2OG-Fe(II) oxygenase family protein [Usitatibacter palustris]|nr:2OG-Fe(II) oxygenase family protein [Usitatibacter palustris]